jgi:hypothetical protein
MYDIPSSSFVEVILYVSNAWALIPVGRGEGGGGALTATPNIQWVHADLLSR